MDGLELMDRSRHPDLGMDVVIIVVSSANQEAFWQSALEQSLGRIFKSDALGIVVYEDWPGGAGNGLGTLYAYQQARKKAKQLYGIDIWQRQAAGASVAMYHTAGMGKRLFPIAGAEHNNKSAVRLACGGGTMTLLEAVIRQTAIYSSSRRGRLSVFWGDQIFIPSKAPTAIGHHADLLVRLVPMPTAETWKAQQLSRYGLLVVDPNGDAKQLEKIDYPTFCSLIEEGFITQDSQIGISLGSFSLSLTLLQALLEAFVPELTSRTGSLDSDSHFWMALTLNESLYLRLLTSKGMSKDQIQRHYARMQALKKGLQGSLLGIVEVGKESYWWDYGSIGSYYRNSLKLTSETSEGNAMRHFFDLTQRQSPQSNGSLDVDDASILVNCSIRTGKIRNSVVIGLYADTVDINHSVIIDTAAPTVELMDSLSYGVIETDSLKLPTGAVRADVFVAEGQQQFKMVTQLDADGKEDWQNRLNDNPLSYAKLWQINHQSSLNESHVFSFRLRQQLLSQLELTVHKKFPQ